MDLKQIQELMLAMAESSIDKLSWREGESHLQLERAAKARGEILSSWASNESGQSDSSPTSPDQSANVYSKNVAKSEREAPNTRWVSSPMVGTLYLTPGPDAPPFVKVGDLVSEESVLCIVEAMKVMNEIRAPFAGRIANIPLGSESSVEFGSKLMLIAEV